jgi:general secretion pathway protein C
MSTLFERYFWVVRWVAIGGIVALAGSICAQAIGVGVILAEDDLTPAAVGDAPPPDAEEDEPAASFSLADATPSVASRNRMKDKVASDLVSRNPFCPTCRPPEAIEAPAGVVTPTLPTEPGAPVAMTGATRSALPLMLLATMEADDPTYSMATIQDTEIGTLGSFSRLDAVRPGVTVELVERGRVFIRNGAALEYIGMGEEPPPPPPVVKAAEPAKVDDRLLPGAEDAIKCDGDNCTIDRAFVEELLQNPAALTKQARVVPAVKDGETRGFKFYGIRPGSLPKMLGLNNGDLLTSVNGQELTSLDQAMDLYTKLRRASNLSITIERKDQTITKEFEIK